MRETWIVRSMPLAFLLLSACSGGSPNAPATAGAPAPSAQASSVAGPAASGLLPTVGAEVPASPLPVSPERAPASPLEQAPSPVVPLGPFVPSRLARTKLGLIQRVDAALRAGDPARLGEVWLDAAAVGAQCTTGPGTAELAAKLDDRRERAAAAFAACLAIADWSKAEYLVLNYGSRRMGREEACPAWERHESSELFYAIDDVVYKVALHGALASRGGHALAGTIRCAEKRGSAEESRRWSRTFGQPCPRQPWPVLTQVRGPCPRLE